MIFSKNNPSMPPQGWDVTGQNLGCWVGDPQVMGPLWFPEKSIWVIEKSIVWKSEKGRLYHEYTGWWFGTCFNFPYIGSNHPNWLSYFSEGLKPPTRYIICTYSYPFTCKVLYIDIVLEHLSAGVFQHVPCPRHKLGKCGLALILFTTLSPNWVGRIAVPI